MPKLLLLALLAQQPDPWCTDFRRLATAPVETIPFRTLRAANWAPSLLPGCFATRGGYMCHRTLLTAELTADSAAARVAGCLEQSRIEKTALEWGQRRVVRSPTLRVRITETGSERAHVGRMMEILISPVGWRDDADD